MNDSNTPSIVQVEPDLLRQEVDALRARQSQDAAPDQFADVVRENDDLRQQLAKSEASAYDMAQQLSSYAWGGADSAPPLLAPMLEAIVAATVVLTLARVQQFKVANYGDPQPTAELERLEKAIAALQGACSR